jgi:hypothetical protein
MVTSPRPLLLLSVAMGEHHHLPVPSETGPACQRPNIAMESSKFSRTSLSEMKTGDAKQPTYETSMFSYHFKKKFDRITILLLLCGNLEKESLNYP